MNIEYKEVIEPVEYFENVKANISYITYHEIINVQKHILKEIQSAKDIGQVILANDLLFTYEVTQKELLASANGFNKYVSRDVVQKFVDKIEPIGSVKVTDLEKYPRIIPEENANIIKQAKELGIFDRYAVIFTDLENNVTHTEADKEFIERNKDPIVLGYFYNKEYRQKYDRYYVITDWIDEYCDLTFDTMVRKISEMKIETNEETLGEIDLTNIKEYIDKGMASIYGRPIINKSEPPPIKSSKQTFFSKMKFW